jgi:hypothetical protein
MNIEDLLKSVSNTPLPEEKILSPITLTFGQFLKSEYKRDKHNLYIIWKDGLALYVGISKTDIRTRWFTAGYGHMSIARHNKQLTGISPIGRVIQRNLPESLDWAVELRHYSTFSWTDSEKLIEAEQRLIHELRPLFNTTYRPPLTEQENELIERLTHVNL